MKISGDAARWNYPCDDADYFEQPGKLFRLMSPEQKEALFGNTARALGDAPKEIKLRHIRNCASRSGLWRRWPKACGISKAKSEPFSVKASLTQFACFKRELLSRRHARAADADPKPSRIFRGRGSCRADQEQFALKLSLNGEVNSCLVIISRCGFHGKVCPHRALRYFQYQNALCMPLDLTSVFFFF